MIKKSIFSILLLLTFFWQNSVVAAQTQFITMKGSIALSKGTFDNVQLNDKGHLLLSSKVKEVVDTQDLLIQSIAPVKGGVYFGTAQEPEVYYYDFAKNKQQLIFNAKGLSISAMTTSSKGLYFIESPSNKLYFVSFDKIKKENSKPTLLGSFKDVSYIWGLKYYKGNLYAITGAKALLYKVNISKNKIEPEILFEAKEEEHLITFTVKNDQFYLGGQGLGGVYKVNPNTGKSMLLFQTYEGEVSSIFVDNSHNVYFTTSNKAPKKPDQRFDYTDAFIEQQMEYQMNLSKLLDNNMPLNKAIKVAQGIDDKTELFVKNSLYKYSNKVTKKLFTIDNLSLNTVIKKDSQTLIVGASDGRVYSYNEKEGVTNFLTFVPDEDVVDLEFDKDHIYLFSANLGRIYKLPKETPSKGTYLSTVIDLTQNSVLGIPTIETQNEQFGDVQVYMRGGNTKNIDKNWSDWEGPFTSQKEKRPKLQQVHYIQYKVEMSGNKGRSPQFISLLNPYMPQNLGPSISLFNVNYDRSNQNTPPYILNFQWNVTSTDKAGLLYKIFFKKKADIQWQNFGETVGQTKLAIDTRNLPDGVYKFRLRVSDELNNSSARASFAERESEFITVDNTAPTIMFDSVKTSGQNLTIKGTIEDKMGIILKAYYKAGTLEDWAYIDPDEKIYDSKKLHFTLHIKLKSLKENIENWIFIRVLDANLNQCVERVKVSSKGELVKD
jgi:hypothetical protein